MAEDVRSNNRGNSVKDATRINEAIKTKEVRLIDEEGEMLGIYTTEDALNKAYDKNLDLVEISPEAIPPVCKIMNYGKYKYELQKRKQEAKKKQKAVVLKELYIHLNIEEHDYQVKLRNTRRFLEDSAKVKIIVKLRGREKAQKDRALIVLHRFYEDLGKEEHVRLEMPAKIEGDNAIVIFAPLTVK